MYPVALSNSQGTDCRFVGKWVWLYFVIVIFKWFNHSFESPVSSVYRVIFTSWQVSPYSTQDILQKRTDCGSWLPLINHGSTVCEEILLLNISTRSFEKVAIRLLVKRHPISGLMAPRRFRNWRMWKREERREKGGKKNTKYATFCFYKWATLEMVFER